MSAKFLPYKEDLYTVFCVLSFLALMMVPFFWKVPYVLVPFWLLVSCFFSFCVNLINHNHSHVPTFGPYWANYVFGLFLVLTRGASAIFIELIHGQHHQYEGTSEDWFWPGNEGEGPALIRLWRYIFRTAGRFKKDGKARYSSMSKGFMQTLRVERVVLGLWTAFLLYLGWKTFLVFVLFPWLFGNFFLVLTNLFFHKYAEPKGDVNVSVNFENSFENLVFFNGGLHTAHHLRPSVHWSQLKALHEREVVPHAKSELLRGSMMLYFIKHFVLGMKREIL